MRTAPFAPVAGVEPLASSGRARAASRLDSGVPYFFSRGARMLAPGIVQIPGSETRRAGQPTNAVVDYSGRVGTIEGTRAQDGPRQEKSSSCQALRSLWLRPEGVFYFADLSSIFADRLTRSLAEQPAHLADMNPQQEAVALWKFLESRGARPSVNAVADILRSPLYKLRFREVDLFEWLKPFRVGKLPGREREVKNTHGGSVREENGKRLRARDKVPLVSSFESKDSSKTLFPMDEPTPKAAAKPRATRPPLVLEAIPPPPEVPAEIPEDPDAVKHLAEQFVIVFANSKTPKAIAESRPDYAYVLTVLRGKRKTVAEAWALFSEALMLQDGRPLFRAMAKKVLGMATYGRSKPEPEDDGLDGFDPDINRIASAREIRAQMAKSGAQ